MEIETQVADAVARNVPLVVVGDEPLLSLVLSAASSLRLGTARVEAEAIAGEGPLCLAPRGGRTSVVAVTGCAGSIDEDALLDLAFDGDPRLPEDSVVALHFESPTACSDALADLASELGHCVLIHGDDAAAPRMRLAA